MSSGAPPSSVLATKLSNELLQLIAKVVAVDAIKQVTPDDFAGEFTSYRDGMFGAVLCEISEDSEFAMEVGQTCRNTCPKTPSFVVTFNQAMHQPKSYKKNGFTDSFFLPADTHLLLEALTLNLSSESLSKRAYKQIRVPDLQAGTQLGFDTYVFLPLNKRHVLFSSGRDKFSEKKVEKLNAHHLNTIYIDQKDSDQFYSYVANQFKSFDNNLSETERAEKLQQSVRGIFSEIFDQTEVDFEAGKELLSSCRKIVSTYITGKPEKDFYGQLIKMLGGQRLEYSHSADVSTFAALFGMASGFKAVDDLALAGFLHDLALAQFPFEHGSDPDPSWDEPTKQAYLAHPQKSVDLIKLKRIIISPVVEKMILGHHEKYIGTGFPKQLRGDRINEGTQILSIADQFFYLTSPREGHQRRTPAEAFAEIERNGTVLGSVVRKIRDAILPN
jgi:HD-GYP domain-containing protein (c-di-GMP phosphodiesterase class II)